ncbi:CZB domain-containing protein [Burkholderia sp. 4M9327F10]|uniref:CZB domain-containing protein n=1 Tax=Burkholderia sp. 4M9327F10 TaxID=2502223 RepID=UPI0010F65F3A|nr:CZB domain-containing protein [Burkholderia sp. 4M9327F10]
MLFDDTLEEHRMAGVSLRCGMHQRVQLITCAFANERSCALGRWLHEEGTRCDEFPELQQLRMAHASFHTITLVIAISITQGRLAEAAVMLEPDALFESATRMLIHAVSRFEKRSGVGAAPASKPAPFGLIH